MIFQVLLSKCKRYQVLGLIFQQPLECLSVWVKSFDVFSYLCFQQQLFFFPSQTPVCVCSSSYFPCLASVTPESWVFTSVTILLGFFEQLFYPLLKCGRLLRFLGPVIVFSLSAVFLQQQSFYSVWRSCLPGPEPSALIVQCPGFSSVYVSPSAFHFELQIVFPATSALCRHGV